MANRGFVLNNSVGSVNLFPWVHHETLSTRSAKPQFVRAQRISPLQIPRKRTTSMKPLTLRLKVVAVFCLTIVNYAHSQHIPEFLLRTPVLIRSDKGEQGSGFYVQDSLHTYLATARHVLIDKIITNNKTHKDSVVLSSKNIRCISYPIDPNSSEKVILTIDLAEAFQSGVLKYEVDSDIGAIQLGDNTRVNDSLSLINYYPFASKDKSSHIESVPRSVIQKYADIHIGDDVLVFGYPTSIGLQNAPQFDHERPLLRKGTIAGKNIRRKTLIIDCPIYYGNSGGPVIVAYTEDFAVYYKLIGVISEFIPYEDDWVNTKNGLTNISITNSGYSVVVPIESIFDLFKR